MDYVTLANGKKVDWDEFSTWSNSKQLRSIRPPNAGKIGAKGVGKKISETRRLNAANGHQHRILRDGDHVSSKSILTPAGEFSSLKKAAEHYSVGGQTLRSWIKKGVVGFAYLNSLEDKNEKKTRQKGAFGKNNPSSQTVVTPDFIFESKRQAQISLGISRNALDKLIQNSDQSGFHLIKNNTTEVTASNNVKMVVSTPDGEFCSVKDAANYYEISPSAMRHRLVSPFLTDFFYLD